ncbi:MAG TPA: ATP-binding protein [Candidatus Eisenbacteria bacterium]|nr:ATP-binding protein [Candidatus Eisenbacteria bacterium]
MAHQDGQPKVSSRPQRPRRDRSASGWISSVAVGSAAAVTASVLLFVGILEKNTELLLVAVVNATLGLVFWLFASLVRARRSLEEVGRAHLMYESARRLSGTLLDDEIHNGLRELISSAMSCDGMIVSSFDPTTRTVRCVYGWVSGGRFDHQTLPVLTIDLEEGGGMQTEVIRTGEGRLYEDVTARVKHPGGRYYDVGPGGEVRDLMKPDAAPPGSKCALMVPIKLDGAVVGIVQVMSDTPKAYRHEHLAVLESLVAPMAVALQNAELYARANREIRERARVEAALTSSEERLLEADRRKDEFLATLSHELRNPLAPIRMAVDLLPEGTWDAKSGEKLAWCREVIERQVGHMARLLDDLLDVSRISRGKLPLRKQRVDLAEVMRHAIEASVPLIQAGGHGLNVVLPAEAVTLHADPTRLAQVFLNLLNNAARYSDHGSKIYVNVGTETVMGAPGAGGARVSLGAHAREAVVRVRDNGIGIAPEMLPRIFDPFVQIDRSMERSQGGLGIGLTLVKQIVEIHGGRVEVASEGLGKGSEFTVRLPMAAAAEGPAVERKRNGAESPASGPRSRILVVDDLRDSADSLAMMLKTKGHEVRTAYDGLEAVEAAREFRPEVVLLDIGMPRLDGYEAARRIREQCDYERLVLIAITGWGHDENRARTREAGFDHHLVKPVEPATLARLLAKRVP